MLSAVANVVHPGDVVEVEMDDEVVSALVLLASDDTVILDACDGRTPFVVRPSDLLGSRVYSGQVG
ncbi:MAG: hypothetical protein JWM12_454 [Ilumatobacteraceae bacterium]|jgi:magnesium-transporting ATPase (P-type)|nr:hypothetical protein [Ilumatobacteraceae bacterium]